MIYNDLYNVCEQKYKGLRAVPRQTSKKKKTVNP